MSAVDTLVKLWPVITGMGVASFAVFRYISGRTISKKRVEQKRQDRSDELAEQAMKAANQATWGQIHLLEASNESKDAEIRRLNKLLELAHSSELEAWRRGVPLPPPGTTPQPPSQGSTT